MKGIFNNYKSSFYYLKYKILFIICVLIIFRIGSFIPILGIDINILNNFFVQNNNSNIIEMLNIFSGNSLSHMSIFSLGLIPYISASIIVQIIIFIYPKLIKKNKKISNNINKIIKYFTLFFAIFQSIIILINFNKIFQFNNLIVNYSNFLHLIFIINLITGSMILMWLGEKITENSICNGISIIMCIGILIGFPPYINNILLNKKFNNFIFLKIILFLLLLFIIIFIIFFIECSQRKIFLNHQQNKNRCKFYSNKNIYLPIKINISGVIPIIFSSSVVLFITNLIYFIIKKFNKYIIIEKIILCLQPGNIIYIILYINFIILFSFLCINLFFNSKETANNLKKSNTFIYGIRPGSKTEKYINNIVIRLNNLGIIYILFICLIPELFNKIIGIPFYLCGNSILIVTLVIIDFISQIQTLLIEKQYNSIFKKNNF
ncbi:MAG: preprotein translocase subunit SecY [Enterobacteriaceae bacterium PC38]|nr:MAG: preprotein translocase subunit SecY [Enterobacteriaceae bacterium PC38]